jgi:hypothetical protein
MRLAREGYPQLGCPSHLQVPHPFPCESSPAPRDSCNQSGPSQHKDDITTQLYYGEINMIRLYIINIKMALLSEGLLLRFA